MSEPRPCCCDQVQKKAARHRVRYYYTSVFPVLNTSTRIVYLSYIQQEINVTAVFVIGVRILQSTAAQRRIPFGTPPLLSLERTRSTALEMRGENPAATRWCRRGCNGVRRGGGRGDGRRKRVQEKRGFYLDISLILKTHI